MRLIQHHHNFVVSQEKAEFLLQREQRGIRNQCQVRSMARNQIILLICFANSANQTLYTWLSAKTFFVLKFPRAKGTQRANNQQFIYVFCVISSQTMQVRISSIYYTGFSCTRDGEIACILRKSHMICRK